MSNAPLRQQYLDIKRRHRDALLLFRIGDFYEAFDDDARLLARELDIVLTSKPMGRNMRVPLAGIPYHSLERHLATLIARGHRVAICEQISNAPIKGETTGRGLIERDVVRVVTPGTVLEPGLLQSKVNNYLAAFITDGRRAGIAYADVSTGDFAATELDAEDAPSELQRIAAAELLIPSSFELTENSVPGFVTRYAEEKFDIVKSKSVLLRHFGSRTLAPFGLSRWPLAVCASGALISYLNETQGSAAEQLNRLTSYHTETYMVLDERTVRSLEIFEGAGGVPSLLSTLDETRTAMGGRLLRRWLRQPLLDVAEIAQRQEHVVWFNAHEKDRAELFAALENVHDLERLTSRARAGFATPSEILALGQSLDAIPHVRAVLQREHRRFATLIDSLPACEELLNFIRRALNQVLPPRSESGFIRDGFSEELDALRILLRDGKKFLAEMEQHERARTGIKSLRVGYNKVFGYFIEVTRPNLHLVPDDYTRKQTLAAAERFITLALKEYESLVLNAQERVAELELSIFRRVCAEIAKGREQVQTAARTIAHLDVIASFAESAARWNYVRPRVADDDARLRIRGGRHPVLERTLEQGFYVSNDAELGGESAPEIALITGPNMSGKSTYLRQTALIALMAQTGSFVPATSAIIGLTDRIYTRIGLYDRIGSGESTFMTEMIETAHILHHATPRSLILLDELGRGTSTYDGLAVARAVLEHIHNHPQLRSKTLFATHYHELTELSDVLPRLKNLHVEIAERGTELVFLYKISPGVAEKSYGIYAAQLAGLPRPVIRRAQELLGEYEEQANYGFDEKYAELLVSNVSNSSLANARENVLSREVQKLDLDSLSPVEALMALFELRRMVEDDQVKNLKALKSA